ncbi:MAG: helix-turn-helix transcriptional regulator [Pseudomonadota bacterium]|nr:helix-turn-helix transcriptional regulator [Pseudomonadota bacterium]
MTALELSERLRALRLARNLSQAELAQMAGTSLSSIRRLEGAGQGTLVLLVRVAQALNVAHELDGLFVPNSHSIAQAEALADTRQRASKARGQGKP